MTLTTTKTNVIDLWAIRDRPAHLASKEIIASHVLINGGTFCMVCAEHIDKINSENLVCSNEIIFS